MYLPPQLKKISWQHALIGAFAGGVIAYVIIMFMYGTMYEERLEDNVRLEAKISELQAQKDSLKSDEDDQGEQDSQLKEQLKVQGIDVTINNKEELRLDRLTNYQLKELVKKEIDHIIGRDMESVGDNARLLISTLENKTFKLDNTNYFFSVKRLIVAQNIRLNLKARLHQ